MKMLEIENPCTTNCHAELVSASIAPQSQAARVDGWTLNQVQGDGVMIAPQGQVRVGNYDVMNNVGGVLTFILETLRSDDNLHPNPSPEGEGLKEVTSFEGRIG